MAINILDSLIINRISAGEVVESPFSIIKELIDNSIDAGADKISVEIKNGGIDSIIVKDNGKGIDYDDIVKAFLPHATSKIKDINDLDAISTLGFRGEALASISNVSQTTMTTKTVNSDCAYSLDVFGGEFGEVVPTSFEVGTKIEVNNLFYNTPVRRKFLKKPKQEENQITNIMSRYILANPTISFKYIADDRVVYHSKGGDLLNAISCVYGDEITQNILPVNKTIDNISLTGFVSKVGFSKPNTNYQTLIINSRYVIDEIVSKAVYMANEEYLMSRQFPFYVLNLTMPNIDVDVNVHPSKMNVKFSNPSRIYDLVYSAVKSTIYNSLNPNLNIIQNNSEVEDSLINVNPNSLKEIEIEPNTNFKLDSGFKLKQNVYSPITIFDLKESVNESKAEKIQSDNINTKEPVVNNQSETNFKDTINIKQTEIKFDETTNQNINQSNMSDIKIVGQIFSEFVILEKNDKMLLLDFHAGHERLNYDRFTNMLNKRELVVQNLLIPYVHSLTEQEVDYILSLKDELSTLGFDIDMFGDKKIIINAVPMLLKDINLKRFVEDLIHDMKNIKPVINDEFRQQLMQKACKSSVKSGQTLTEHEIYELLKNLDDAKPVLLCPHGRPVITVITKNQIEKWFKRLV